MRLCSNPQCNNVIPWYKEIDGVLRHLANRKFCLECSPFGQHNTSRYLGLHRKKQKNKTTAKAVYKFRSTRKRKLVELFGGKCIICKYDKCIRAMHFHHIDRSTKNFSLNSTEISCYPWEKVVEEAKKCQLVCSNCHAEIEDKVCGSKYRDDS